MDDREFLVDNEHLEEYSEHETPTPPQPTPLKDKFYLTHSMFFLIGLSQLLPWNFMITATNFWMYKFRDTNATTKYKDETQTYIRTHFDSYLAIASNFPFLIVFMISLNRRFKRISDIVKNTTAFISTILVFMIITAFVLINTDKYQLDFLYLILILVFLLNSSTVMLQANFAGVASLFPTSCMHLMVTGQAVSGLFASVAQIFTLVGNWPLIYSTFAYFLLADLTVLLTFILYFVVRRMEFFKYHITTSTEITNINSFDDMMDQGIYMKVFKKMWPFCLTLLLVFWVTIALYPGLLVLIKPMPDALLFQFLPVKLFLPICCFLTFNLCDFLGRYLGQYLLLPKEKGVTVVLIALARVIFIPLFLFCNAQPRHLPVWFEAPVYFMLFLVLFGLLNGYLVLHAFMNGPLTVPPEYRHISGFFLILFLGLGLTLGSVTSPFIVDLL